MAVHTLGIKHEMIGPITRGEKTLEVRVKNRKTGKFVEGDLLVLVSPGSWVEVKITAVRRYQSFVQMAQHEDIGHIAPGMTEKKLVRALHTIFPNQEHLGVLVFEIEFIRARER